MSEHFHFGANAFAEVALGEAGPSTTTLVGDGHGKAFVAGCGQQSRLAEARAARDDTAFRIQFGDALGEVQASGEGPGPGPEGGGVVVAGFVALPPEVEDARVGEWVLLELRIGFIGIWVGGDFAVACAHGGIASCDDHPQREGGIRVWIGAQTARSLRGMVVWCEFALMAPGLHHGDVWVGHKFMVATIVESQNDRHGLFCITWAEDNPGDARSCLILYEPHFVLAANNIIRHGVAFFIDAFRNESVGRRWLDAIHLMCENIQDLLATTLPLLFGMERRAVCKGKRILKGIGGYGVFVVTVCP